MPPVNTILEDFHKEENRLMRQISPSNWKYRIAVFLDREFRPVCARYSFEENRFVELSYVTNKLNYIKL